MQFCLFKTRFYISYYFIVFIGLITVCDKTAVFLPVILSAAVHETGHLVAMKIFGCRLLRIELYPFLIKAKYQADFTFKNMIFVYLAGPLFNFIFGVILFIIYKQTANGGVLNLSLISFVVGIYNSLPCAGLDGGSILKLIMLKICPQKAASVISVCISAVFAAAVLWALLAAVEYKPNVGILCLALYLFISTFVTEGKNIGRQKS